MDRRHFVLGSAAAATTLVPALSGAQENYPSHAVTFINPFPPGGAADVVGRPFAAVLEPIIKQPAVIDTKAGAAGAVGAQVAAHAKPDGYTLLLHIVSISGFTEVDKLFGRQPKFTRDDFIPIARFIADPCVLIVNDQTPYKTLKEFTDGAGRRRVKGNMDIELAIDVMEMADQVDHIVIFSGDGDFRRLVEAAQRKGRRVSVVSTIRTSPPMVADELRRQADNFIELDELKGQIARDGGKMGVPAFVQA